MAPEQLTFWQIIAMAVVVFIPFSLAALVALWMRTFTLRVTLRLVDQLEKSNRKILALSEKPSAANLVLAELEASDRDAQPSHTPTPLRDRMASG